MKTFIGVQTEDGRQEMEVTNFEAKTLTGRTCERCNITHASFVKSCQRCGKLLWSKEELAQHQDRSPLTIGEFRKGVTAILDALKNVSEAKFPTGELNINPYDSPTIREASE